MTDHEHLIREAVAAEAARSADPESVRAFLRAAARPKPTWPRLVVITAAAAAVVLAAVLLPLAFRDTATAPVNQIATQPAPTPAPQTVLLAGLDDNGTADTIVLGRVHTDGTVRAVSIPRDTTADVPALTGDVRISTTYLSARDAAKQSGADDVTAQSAGRQALATAVEQLTGVRPDHTATLTTASLPPLVEALGGVDVCVAKATRDPVTGATFRQGPQTLDGTAALAYLRQRHGLPAADLSRIDRAQLFLRNLAQELILQGFTTDPQKRAQLVSLAQRAITTDPGWDLLTLAATLTSQSPVDTRTLPWVTYARSLVVDPAQAKAFTAQQLTPQPSPTTPSAPLPASGDPLCVD
ncbi:LCP family protein [Actinokineospora bangkokensis]|uniref:Cell envelope-related transcriptional attenuator domain-containing protein n=1 Tax=Actinokineospora bangkokensis TaxID=1193682 RepID=A0A1Q9LD27_9PSEU|nr:LCP family protein [Actinokineospora bangkokensis]OLR89914.1 hypothetical protein BJP25_02635 [Actinokineospora bangkokensis]